MELIQKGYSCEFEMNIFINIFFEKSEEGKIFTDFSHKDDKILVNAKIEFEGTEYNSEYSCSFSSLETDKRIIKKIYSCACTKAFIRAAKKIR